MSNNTGVPQEGAYRMLNRWRHLLITRNRIIGRMCALRNGVRYIRSGPPCGTKMSGTPKTAVREEPASQDIPYRAGQVNPDRLSGQFP